VLLACLAPTFMNHLKNRPGSNYKRFWWETEDCQTFVLHVSWFQLCETSGCLGKLTLCKMIQAIFTVLLLMIKSNSVCFTSSINNSGLKSKHVVKLFYVLK
jgi:hypothetical protein